MNLDSALDWHFAQPAWFALLFFWFVWQALRQRRYWLTPAQRKPIFFHPLIARFISAHRQPSKHRHQPLNYLPSVIMLLLISALAQPQRQIEQPPQLSTKPVRDIALIVESSVSFVLEDYRLNQQPATRMAVVKHVLNQFVGSLAQNRFSLLLYGEQAYTLVPMTADTHAVQLNLQRLQPYLAGRTDQAMGEAIGLALRDIAQADAGLPKRLIVLISDGLQQPSRLDLARIVEYAQSLNVPIYTIGIGAGSHTADLRTHSGLIYQPLETDSLRFLAEQTGGQYFQVGGQQDLKRVLSDIERRQAAPYQQDQQPRHSQQDLSAWPMTLAFMLLLVSAFARMRGES
jgi:Ca-activated chloride channel family protein